MQIISVLLPVFSYLFELVNNFPIHGHGTNDAENLVAACQYNPYSGRDLPER
jgi:hypothetical protein